MKKSLLKLVTGIAIFLLSGLFPDNVSAQQPQQQPQPQPQPQQQPPQRRAMRPSAPTLGKHYLQTENTLKPPSENWANPTGPFKVIMEVDVSLPLHTIYRPADLSVFPTRGRLPIIVMSGPGCDFDGDNYRPFWTEIASHGYLVVAVGLPVPDGLRAAMFFNKYEDVLDGIDWAFAINKRKAGKYYDKLDTLNVVLMGQSCGGSLITRLVDDKRVTGLVYWNSSSAGGMMGANTEQTSAADFHQTITKPLAYFAGGTDMARQGSLASYEKVVKAPAFSGVREIPGDAHGGTFREKNGGGYGVAAVAWLNWWTKGDKEAAKMFKGDPCGLAKDPNWIELKSKNLN